MTETFRGTVRVHSSVIQKWVALAKKSNRYWVSYPAHEIEQILWDYSIIPPGVRYRTFDANTDEAIFVIPVHQDSEIPTFWERTKAWLRKKLT